MSALIHPKTITVDGLSVRYAEGGQDGPDAVRWPLVNPDRLPVRVKPGKSRYIVARACRSQSRNGTTAAFISSRAPRGPRSLRTPWNGSLRVAHHANRLLAQGPRGLGQILSSSRW